MKECSPAESTLEAERELRENKCRCWLQLIKRGWQPTWRLHGKKELGEAMGGGDTRGDGLFSKSEKGRRDGQEASTENTGQKKPLSEVREHCLTNDFLNISAEGKIDIV